MNYFHLWNVFLIALWVFFIALDIRLNRKGHVVFDFVMLVFSLYNFLPSK